MTNQAKRINAELALTVYLRSKGRKVNQQTLEEDATDLLTDLLHLAHKQGADPERILSIAKIHFQAEVNDDDDD